MRTVPAVALAAGLVMASCVGCVSPDDVARDRTSPPLPPTSGAFDYQLGTAYGEPGELDVVVRDGAADPLEGAYNVCYVNGFQTQPGTLPDWERHRPEALLREDDGAPVVDPDWPDEAVLDPSTPGQREEIVAVVAPLIDGCAAAGFDAVEIDNLDTFLRFDGVDRDGALALARVYADRAHAHGLAIAQKNAAELGAAGRDDVGFDLAVVEECAAFEECAAYRAVYGPHVLQVEYVGDDDPSPTELCTGEERAPLTIVRDRLLVGPHEEGYVREQCPTA
ncbi:endo alpha-1,4 polygalactosaminidase [Georgenia satyanarayanai]|uniref:endo alpha-1,4 polygalactosaminidase n=1 Tax=Georgenia satyanarayanai TaxID=860221 RepID=UPI00203D97AF|nr:endo alpha-1,4 polygalactosaminidase [Georgenia satyanarayanai]MCM3661223.1 endo alpha-1,4 polygalactosaminidase [Georgenia satyanarayanai]